MNALILKLAKILIDAFITNAKDKKEATDQLNEVIAASNARYLDNAEQHTSYDKATEEHW